MSHTNVLRFCDFAHGAHKDLQVALKQCSLFDLILVFMISANVLHGPDKDDMRFHQIRDAMRVAYTTLNERTPIFADLAPGIHEDLRNAGHTFPNEDPLEVEVWRYGERTEPFTKKGTA